MAYKPSIITLNDFVKLNQDTFTPYELWLTDELTDYLIAKRNLEKSYTSIVIDLDEDAPVYGFKDNNILLRFNGRFYIPVEDKNLNHLELRPEQWVELCQDWFKDQDIEVIFDEKAMDVIKFTAIISCLEMPEEAESSEGETPEGETPEGESEESGTSEEKDEEPLESPEETGKESSEETSEEPTEPESEESDEELKEFEKALGL